MNLIRKNKYLFNKCKTYYEKRTHMSYIKNLNQIPVDDDSIFIESFHGKNFSGDPKYIALAIKRQYDHKKIYVSSTNSLVDMEIKRYGFTPVRFGSEKYIKTFRKFLSMVTRGIKCTSLQIRYLFKHGTVFH